MMFPKPVRKHKKRITISLAQQTRLYARAGGWCERCKDLPDFRGLSIHHLTLKGTGGTKEEYEDDELEVVCGGCSSKYHGIREV
jgi:Zn finger protein HypA/HybF involved in hydrogenase expression